MIGIGGKRLWALLFLIAACAAIIVLAGSLPRLELRPAEPFALEEPQPKTGEDDLGLEGLGSGAAFWSKVLLAMWLIMLACVPVGLVLLVLSPQARRQALTYVGPLLVLLVILLLTRVETEEPATVEPLPPGELSAPAAEGTPTVFTPEPPRWLSTLTNTALGVAAAAAFGGIAWFIRHRGRQTPGPLEQLAREAQSAVTAIQAGADLRDTIMRCYFEMSRVLRTERGIAREQAMTPREFESHLAGLGLPQAPVRELTRLFEAVRYGTRVPDGTDERRAIQSLSAVVEVCRSAP